MILGPYGEGYCRHCHFVVALWRDGTLIHHTRGPGGYGTPPAECKGSGRRPAKRTPVTSRKAAFRLKAHQGQCPVCDRTVDVVPAPSGKGWLVGQHRRSPFGQCDGVFRTAPSPVG